MKKNLSKFMKNGGYTPQGFTYTPQQYQQGGISNICVRDNNNMHEPTYMYPVPAMRATNGMMEMGGYLEYANSYAPIATYADGGWANNGGVQSIDDIGRQNSMGGKPGMHWTNQGWQPSHGSTMNGASYSQYGGIQNFMPRMNEYAILQDGGMIDNDSDVDQMKSGGIHIKPENKGKFTAYKKRTGKTTEEALHSKDPHVRQMANFARNSAHWNHKEYGGNTFQNGGLTVGSQHELEDHEIQNLIAQGYKIKFL